ncbi:MAG: M23 family metallopeptidase [Endomicrobia bacterium]|nr:M23 family metallopeptidase [Endomicrobiia bacterium]
MIADEERSSLHFVIDTPIEFDQIVDIRAGWGVPRPEGGQHNGIDIHANAGTKFIASSPGIIISVEDTQSVTKSNKNVFIMYNSEYILLYGFEPVKELAVAVGQNVRPGDTIGYIGGSTAKSDGIHLHFGLMKNNEYICPIPYLKEEVRKKFNEIYRSKPRPSNYPKNLCNCAEHQHLFD